jgi:hypothetical protein
LFLAQLKTKERTYREGMKTKEEKDTENHEDIDGKAGIKYFIYLLISPLNTLNNRIRR